MNAIVSLLDEEHDQTLRNLWAELEDYDLDELRQILEGLIVDHRPFTVGTSGLGVFTGDRRCCSCRWCAASSSMRSTAHSGRGAPPPSASDSPPSSKAARTEGYR